MLQQINGNTIVCISSFAAQTDDKFIIQELNVRRIVGCVELWCEETHISVISGL